MSPLHLQQLVLALEEDKQITGLDKALASLLTEMAVGKDSHQLAYG